MRKEQQWCVSIYMPTHRTGTETQQDPLRLRNLLGEAEKRLSARGVSTRAVQEMLELANKLLQDSYFWQHQSDGLAIFLSSHRVRSYRLPLNFEEFEPSWTASSNICPLHSDGSATSGIEPNEISMLLNSLASAS
jgi:hypothetical protein